MASSTLPVPDLPAPPGRRPRAVWLAAALILVLVAGVTVLAVAVHRSREDSRRHYLGTTGWPVHGQAAYAVGTATLHQSPRQRPVPIASLAKVMTALLVLRAAPLQPGSAGFRMSVSAGDVADTARRTGRDESVVPVRQGEVLTERQALAALLLPSANNVAIMLARHVSGSVTRFVARMNRAARRLGLRRTTYTDPSGYAASTVSTAADQARLAQIAMLDASFARLVARTSYRLPVAGTVANTDMLLGTGGFVGIKTGSDDAAGGCFMFRAYRRIDGRREPITGVVLGQPGHNLIRTGQYAAEQLVDRIAPQD